MRIDPMVLRSVQRWNHPAYPKRVLEGEEHRAEFSHDNHFMYWQHPRNKQMQQMAKQAGWKPPTYMQTMTYQLWLDHANATNVEQLPNESDHWCWGKRKNDKTWWERKVKRRKMMEDEWPIGKGKKREQNGNERERIKGEECDKSQKLG